MHLKIVGRTGCRNWNGDRDDADDACSAHIHQSPRWKMLDVGDGDKIFDGNEQGKGSGRLLG
jgi:hypothetical protein